MFPVYIDFYKWFFYRPGLRLISWYTIYMFVFVGFLDDTLLLLVHKNSPWKRYFTHLIQHYCILILSTQNTVIFIGFTVLHSHCKTRLTEHVNAEDTWQYFTGTLKHNEQNTVTGSFWAYYPKLQVSIKINRWNSP